MGDQDGTIVWKRRYDEAVHAQREKRFWLFYAAPAAVIIVITAVVAGFGGAAGLLILFGLFGAMLYLWVWLTSRNERTNPTVILDGGRLHWGKRSVPIADVVRFSTFMGSASASVSPNTTARATLGKAKFLLIGDTEIEFVWAELEEAQLDELRAALEAVMPGRWRPIDDLRAG